MPQTPSSSSASFAAVRIGWNDHIGVDGLSELSQSIVACADLVLGVVAIGDRGIAIGGIALDCGGGSVLFSALINALKGVVLSIAGNDAVICQTAAVLITEVLNGIGNAMASSGS